MTTINRRARISIVLVTAHALLAGCATLESAPSPFTTQLTTADNRTVSVRVWQPGGNCNPCDAMFFSHGNNLSIDQYDEILGPWANAGYLILAPLHVDSESHPDRERYAQPEVFPTRMQDIAAVLSALANRLPGVVGNVELSGRYYAAGHSYGALVAQIVGGAAFEGAFSYELESDRQMPVGVIALSPPGPFEGYIFAEGWRHVSVPQLVVTGTADSLPNFAPDWRAHLVSHEEAPEGLSVALVFDDMDHYFNGAFGRLKPGSASRDLIVDRLNERVLRFAGLVGSGDALSDLDLEVLSGEGVRALVR